MGVRGGVGGCGWLYGAREMRRWGVESERREMGGIGERTQKKTKKNPKTAER